MIEFLRKFENRGIKIARANSILITKSINLEVFTLIFYGVGVCFDRGRFSVLSPFINCAHLYQKAVSLSLYSTASHSYVTSFQTTADNTLARSRWLTLDWDISTISLINLIYF